MNNDQFLFLSKSIFVSTFVASVAYISTQQFRCAAKTAPTNPLLSCIHFGFGSFMFLNFLYTAGEAIELLNITRSPQ
jgi:hypothetical protein